MPKFLPQKTKLQPLLPLKILELNQIKIKIAQLQNKLKAEQAELTAVNNELKIAGEDQLNRQNKMYEEGLVSSYSVATTKCKLSKCSCQENFCGK